MGLYGRRGGLAVITVMSLKDKNKRTPMSEKMGTYSEDGWVARVKILKDNSDEESDAFTLEVVDTLRHSRLYKSPPNGEVFDVWHKKNSGYFAGMWRLVQDGD